MLALCAGMAALAAPPQVVVLDPGYTHVYALVGEGGVVIVDSQNPGHEDALLAALDEAGIARERVTALLLTHGHADHAGSAAALAGALNVPIVAGAGDREMLAAGEPAALPATGGRGAMLKPVLRHQFPPAPIDVVVTDLLDLNAFGVDATAGWVGGHTAGSLAVVVEGDPVLVGDLIRGRLGKWRVPTLHFFHEDGNAAHRALAGLLDGGPSEVLPAHGRPLATAEVVAWLDRRAAKLEKKLERRKL